MTRRCPHCAKDISGTARACRKCWRGGLADQSKYSSAVPRGKSPVIDVLSLPSPGTSLFSMHHIGLIRKLLALDQRKMDPRPHRWLRRKYLRELPITIKVPSCQD